MIHRSVSEVPGGDAVALTEDVLLADHQARPLVRTRPGATATSPGQPAASVALITSEHGDTLRLAAADRAPKTVHGASSRYVPGGRYDP